MKCPNCGNRMQWRRGVGFDHQMICMNCWLVGEPEELERNMIRVLAGKKNNTDVVLTVQDGGQINLQTPTEEWSIGELTEAGGKLFLELHEDIDDPLIETDELGRIRVL